MPYEPTERVLLKKSGLSVTRLGFGAASIGGLFSAVNDDAAVAVVDHAWELGIRYFDVAPLYGYGSGERRLGLALADRPREEFIVSTKVGRLVRRRHEVPRGGRLDSVQDAYYAETGDRCVIFDFSADGVLRSIDESLGRLGLDRIDVALIHDPDDDWEAAIGQAYPALDRLREEGMVRAIGVGMNQSAMLTRFAREGDFDLFLVAGRYTLLDQGALPELMPTCQEQGIGVVIGGVMNSGALANPAPGTRFDYRPADPTVIERARRLAEVCARHGVPLKAAAVQFPLAHPAVASVVAGVRSIDHLDEYPPLMRRSIPSDLWAELRHEGLLPPDAPVPA
jgi:D-threo-aldose 1-dehydrogenase